MPKDAQKKKDKEYINKTLVNIESRIVQLENDPNKAAVLTILNNLLNQLSEILKAYSKDSSMHLNFEARITQIQEDIKDLDSSSAEETTAVAEKANDGDKKPSADKKEDDTKEVSEPAAKQDENTEFVAKKEGDTTELDEQIAAALNQGLTVESAAAIGQVLEEDDGWEIIPPTSEPSPAPTMQPDLHTTNHSFIPSSAPSTMPSSMPAATYIGLTGVTFGSANNLFPKNNHDGPDGDGGIC